MFDLMFNFQSQNWMSAALAGIPALLNIGILLYTHRRLPRDTLTVLFQLYVVGVICWQLFDTGTRLAATEQTATFWRTTFRAGQIFLVPLGLHFATLYAEQQQIAKNWLFWVVLYVPAAMQLVGYHNGMIHEELAFYGQWGWLADTGNMGIPYSILLANGGLVALLTFVVLVWNVHRVRDVPQKRDAALVLAIGVGIPTIVGVTTEVILPAVGQLQIPITSTAATIFSVATLIALSRYQLFQINTPAAQTLIETITDTLMIAAPDGRLLYVNEQAGRVFGVDPIRCQAHHLRTFFPDEKSAHTFFAGRWKDTLEGMRFTGLDAVLLTANSHLTPFLVSLAPIPISRSGNPGVAVVAHDVSRLKSIEADLVAAKDAAELANQSKSLFLANMSHELRTPLNAIIGYSELLEEDTEDEDFRSDLKRIRTSGQYLLQLINDVLDISKVESGKLEVQLASVSIETLIEGLHSEASQMANTRNNQLFITIPPSPIPIFADQTRVRQVCLNLLSNACKFTRDGKVQIRVSQTPTTTFISIEDTGIGMNDAQLSKLFGLFTQVHKVDDRQKYGGTGLGLALSRKLCRLMGGDIHVKSSPGIGTVFTVDLPNAIIPHPE